MIREIRESLGEPSSEGRLANGGREAVAEFVEIDELIEACRDLVTESPG